MAINLVNLGNSANDGTGDDLREAFVKVNNNFTEIQNQLGFTGQNLGSSGAEVFSKLEDYVLKFRRLVAGENIQLQQFDNTIQITAQVPDSRFTVTTDSGSVVTGNGITTNLKVLSSMPSSELALITNVFVVVLTTWTGVPTILLFSTRSPVGSDPLITEVLMPLVLANGSGKSTVTFSSKVSSILLFGSVHSGNITSP